MSGQFLWDSKANISLLQSGYCIFFISVQPRVSCRAPKSGSGVSSNSSHDISSASDLPFSPHEIRVKQRVCAERKKILLPSVNKQSHYSIVQCWRRAACVPVQPWIPSSTGGTMKRLPFFFFFLNESPSWWDHTCLHCSALAQTVPHVALLKLIKEIAVCKRCRINIWEQSPLPPNQNGLT